MEITRALAGIDEQLWAEYDLLTKEARKVMLIYYGTEKDKKWQFGYGKIYDTRNDLLSALFRLIEFSDVRGAKEVVLAQLDFARMQLHT